MFASALYMRHSLALIDDAADVGSSDGVVEVLLRFLTSSWFEIVSLYFSTDLILADGNSSSPSISQGTTFITGPYLDGNGISNVTTQISTHAYLPCKVRIHRNGCNFSLNSLGPLSWQFSDPIIFDRKAARWKIVREILIETLFCPRHAIKDGVLKPKF